MNSKQTALAVLAAGTLAAGATACGGGSTSKSSSPSAGASSSAGPSPSPPSGATASPNGVETMAAKDVVDQSVQALKGAGAARVTGQIKSGSDQYTLDITSDTAGNCAGSITVASQGGFQLIKQGSQLWLKPDQAFWNSHGGAAAAQLFANKYLKTDATNPDYADLMSLCDLNKLANKFGTKMGTATVGAKTTVDGRPAVTVTGSDGNGTNVLYVATQGKPYLLRVEHTSSGDTGSVDFKDFGVPVPTTTPAASDSVDLDQLNKELGASSSSTSAAGG